MDGNLSGGDVGNHLGNEEGIELRTVLLILGIIAHLFLKGLNTPDTDAEDYADAVLVLLLQVPAAVFHGLHGSNHGELRIAVHLTGFLAIQIIVDIEVLHLTGKLRLKQACIKQGDGSSPTHTVDQVVPHLIGRITDWCHST